MKTHTWVVIANSVKANIYEILKKDYSLIHELNHPSSCLKSQELTSSPPGHYQTDHAARGQYVSSANAHKIEHQNFAKEIANFLEAHREKNQYQHIVLCAEPHFYGLLKQTMTGSVQALITKVIPKDYIPLTNSKLHIIIESIIHENF